LGIRKWASRHRGARQPRRRKPVRRGGQVSAREDMTVPTEDLRSAVEDALCRHFDRACSVVEFRREPSQYRSSFALEEIRVRIDDGRTLDIVFKDVSRRGLSVAARAAKPPFLYDSRRENRTHVEALNPLRLRTR